jgi:transposase-like protein
MLSETRDFEAARQFFVRAVAGVGKPPQRVTTDGHPAYPRAIREALGRKVRQRCNPYLNSRLEHDHRRVKQRVRPMLGFQRFDPATITVPGIELVPQIRKGQFDVAAFCSSTTRTPQVWQAVRAA